MPIKYDAKVRPRRATSGNMSIRGKQFRLGPHRAGLTVTFWVDKDLIHLSIAGTRVKTVRSHLTTTDVAALAGPGLPPTPLSAARPLAQHLLNPRSVDLGRDGLSYGLSQEPA